MRIASITTFVVKIAGPHLSFLVLLILNLALKSVAEPAYWSPQFLQEIM